MIALAVLGVIIGVAAPNYSSLMARITVAAETKRMIGILKQARSEAKTRGATVTVSRESNVDWASRILVYESTITVGNAAYVEPSPTDTAGDDLISEHDAASDSVSIRDDAGSDSEFISFSMQGWLSTGELRDIVLAICSPVLPEGDGMYIEVNRVGRIRERSIGSDARGCL